MLEKLTKREKEVLLCIMNGMDNKEIAYELKIARNTVKNHIYSIMRKMQVHRRTQIVVKAYELLPQIMSEQEKQVV